jgi:hypothetical protein
VVGEDGLVKMLCDSEASVDVMPVEDVFKPGTLVECTSRTKGVRVADGTVHYATHVGTVQVLIKDIGGTWRVFEKPGVWLVPGVVMPLMSAVRTAKRLGWPPVDVACIRHRCEDQRRACAA